MNATTEALRALMSEYRPSMNEEVLRSWAADVVTALASQPPADAATDASLPEALAWVSARTLERVRSMDAHYGEAVAMFGADVRLAAKRSEDRPTGLYTADQVREAFRLGLMHASQKEVT